MAVRLASNVNTVADTWCPCMMHDTAIKTRIRVVLVRVNNTTAPKFLTCCSKVSHGYEGSETGQANVAKRFVLTPATQHI
jgi:hypothetical protein